MSSFSSVFTFWQSGYSSLSPTRKNICLSKWWRRTLHLDLLVSVAQIILSFLAWRVLRFHVSNARHAKNEWEYKQRKRQIQEQGPQAGYTVRNVKKMQQNDEKIKDKLNAHISRRLHSSGNPAGLYSGVATHSKVCKTRQGLYSCSCMFQLRQQLWTPIYSSRHCKADTTKRTMFLHNYCQPRIRTRSLQEQ